MAATVLVTGYFDRGNFGDDWMRQALEPLGPTGNRGVQYRRMPSIRVRSLPEAARFVVAVIRSRRLIVAGGTHLTDAWGQRRAIRVLLQHAGVYGLQRATGGEVVLLGIGVDPPRSWATRRLLEAVLRLSTRVIVRDEASLDAVSCLRVPRRRVVLGTDIVLAAAPSLGPVPVRRGTVINLSSHEVIDRTTESIVSALAGASRSGALPGPLTLLVVTSSHPEDGELALRVQAGLMGVDISTDLRRTGQLDDVLDLIRGAEVVVASRYHVCVAAIAAGVPVVGLAYEPKVSSLFREAGSGKAVFEGPLEDLDVGLLIACVDHARSLPSGAPVVAGERRSTMLAEVDRVLDAR